MQGRRPTIGKIIMDHVERHKTVAELAMATGADPRTIRKVLIRAADRGEIVIRRFVRGRSQRAMKVESNETVSLDVIAMNSILTRWER